jgi:hypothetical protein
MEDFEIEECVRKHNRFFKKSNFTLDDLDAYSEPWRKLLWASLHGADGSITEQEAFEVMQRSMSELKAINARIAKKYAA